MRRPLVSFLPPILFPLACQVSELEISEKVPKSMKDGLVKSLKVRFFVIPAQAGIQCFQVVRFIWIPVFTGMTTFYDSIMK